MTQFHSITIVWKNISVVEMIKHFTYTVNVMSNEDDEVHGEYDIRLWP